VLPGAAVAGELVNEHDRSAFADLFIVELHAVVGGEMGHSCLRESASISASRCLPSRVATEVIGDIIEFSQKAAVANRGRL
jgi:hypothetical protein